MQNLSKIEKIFKQINFLIISLILFHAFIVEAAPRKKAIDPNNPPGFISDALAEGKNDDKTKNTLGSKEDASKTPPPPAAPPANKKDPMLSSKKKKATAKKTSAVDQWIPEMGENPDSLDVKQKRMKEMQEEEKLVKDLSELNYNTYIAPKELTNISPENFNNLHIPKVYFQSDYLKMIINAIDNNDYRNLKVIIENYQLINEPHYNGDTILIYAIQNHSLNSARILLGNGANVDATNNQNRTALHYAGALGDVESIRLLLSMGANPNKVDNMNKTPLDYARLGEQYQAELMLSQYLNND